MGANCFKAESKYKIPPAGGGAHMQVSQNLRHSSPLFRWDNRTHIEDITLDASSPIVPTAQPHISNFNGSEIINVIGKSGSDSSGVKIGNFGKFSQLIEQDDNSSPSASSQEAASKSQQENLANSSTKSHTKASSSNTRSEPSVKTSSSKSPLSPKKLIKTQQTSSTIIKSPLSQISSQQGSRADRWNPDSNHWTCQTFNELVASSQRAKSPFNNQNQTVDYIRADTSAFFSYGSSASDERLSCNICTKSLKEKSPLGRRKIWSSTELTASAILVCGHVFHEDCLEKLTPETDIYDPQCPVCMHGMKHVSKMLGKMETKQKKESKDKKPMLEGFFSAEKLKSYSLNGSLSKISFLNRNHASHGSTTPLRSFSQGESSGKKNLLARFTD